MGENKKTNKWTKHLWTGTRWQLNWADPVKEAYESNKTRNIFLTFRLVHPQQTCQISLWGSTHVQRGSKIIVLRTEEAFVPIQSVRTQVATGNGGSGCWELDRTSVNVENWESSKLLGKKISFHCSMFSSCFRHVCQLSYSAKNKPTVSLSKAQMLHRLHHPSR